MALPSRYPASGSPLWKHVPFEVAQAEHDREALGLQAVLVIAHDFERRAAFGELVIDEDDAALDILEAGSGPLAGVDGVEGAVEHGGLVIFGDFITHDLRALVASEERVILAAGDVLRPSALREPGSKNRTDEHHDCDEALCRRQAKAREGNADDRHSTATHCGGGIELSSILPPASEVGSS